MVFRCVARLAGGGFCALVRADSGSQCNTSKAELIVVIEAGTDT